MPDVTVSRHSLGQFASKAGGRTINFGSKIVKYFGRIAMRVWALSGLTLLACLLWFWAYGGILPFLLLCFAATGIAYHSEDQLLFHPEQPPHSRVFIPVPSMFGLPYENIFIRSIDGTMLHMFFVKQPPEWTERAPTILFLHGNAGNMGHRLQNILGLYQHLQCNILTLEYRGYGLSQGTPSEEGLCMDARAALNFLLSRPDVNHKELIVFGRSLGGAVAIDLVSRAEYAVHVWCLVLENTFTSIPEMARVILGCRIFNYLPLICYKNKFLSLAKIPKVVVPTLFISGSSDLLVPPRMMLELVRKCSSSMKNLVQFENGTHNETWTCPGYYHAFAAFINDARVRRVTMPCGPQNNDHLIPIKENSVMNPSKKSPIKTV